MNQSKAKVNLPTRGKSNPPFKNLPPSALLEEQTKKMEKQLQELKEVMAQKAATREESGPSSGGDGDGTRWKSANRNLPIRNYAKTVLESKGKGPLNTQGSQGNKGNFMQAPVQIQTKAAREKLVSREKLPPLTNSNSTTPMGSSLKNKENDPFKDTLSSDPDNFNRTSTPVNNVTANKIPSSQLKQVEGKNTQQSKTTTEKVSSNQDLDNSQGGDPVDNFLDDIGLPQYKQVFKDNGFDDLETLVEIQTKHLVEMKIPAGHQIKLSKRLEQLRQNLAESQSTKVPIYKTAPMFNPKLEVASERKEKQASLPKKSDYVQLEEPTKESGVGDEKLGAGGEFGQGTFNEAESHKSFLEALNEWRSAKPAEEKKPESRAKDSRSKKVRFAEPENENETKGENKKKIEVKETRKPAGLTGGEGHNSQNKEIGTDSSPRALQKPKVSCWNCYQLIAENEAIKVGNKSLCSQKCVDAYRSMNSVTCMKKGCGKKFLKEEGLLEEGRWYCDQKCLPSTEELLIEEQRLLKHLAREMGKGVGNGESEQVDGEEEEQDREDEGGENENEEEQEEAEEEEKIGEENEGGFDLTVSVSNKKEVMSLAELEEKYKNMNQLTEQVQAQARDQENEFEDSLN